MNPPYPKSAQVFVQAEVTLSHVPFEHVPAEISSPFSQMQFLLQMALDVDEQEVP